MPAAPVNYQLHSQWRPYGKALTVLCWLIAMHKWSPRLWTRILYKHCISIDLTEIHDGKQND